MRFLGIKSFWPLFIKTQLHVWPDIRPFSKNPDIQQPGIRPDVGIEKILDFPT